jgi:hypothetical protein
VCVCVLYYLGITVICAGIYCFELFVLCFFNSSFMYIYSCFVCTGVRTAVTE